MEHLIDLFGSDCDDSGEIGAAVKDHLSLPPEVRITYLNVWVGDKELDNLLYILQIEEGNIEYKVSL